MNLIILTDSDRLGEGRYGLTDVRAEHIVGVLKRGVGETVEVGILNGEVGTARIEAIHEGQVTLVCQEMRATAPITPTVDLICALPRPQTLKKVLLTSAMMGVRRLHLVRANRVERSYFQSPLLEPANYTPFLIEGLSQGKLTRLPEVSIHDRFRPFFEGTLSVLYGESGAAATQLRLLPDPAATVNLQAVLSDSGLSPSAADVSIVFAIGPEGGWVPFEIDLMKKVGFRPFLLGRWVLRVEHAVSASLSQLELLWGVGSG